MKRPDTGLEEIKLDATNALLTKDPITAFCEREIASHDSKWPPDEAALATDFIEFVGAKNCVIYEQLAELCVRLSIEVSLVDLPEGHSGINCCYGDRRAIAVSKTELAGLNREHALLHELREILGYRFRELNHPIALKNDIAMFAERAESAVPCVVPAALANAAVNGFCRLMALRSRRNRLRGREARHRRSSAKPNLQGQSVIYIQYLPRVIALS